MNDGDLQNALNRIEALENIIARAMPNGLADLVTGHGYQRFHGGKMRLDSLGVQLTNTGNLHPGMWWTPVFLPPTTASVLGQVPLAGIYGETIASATLVGLRAQNDAAAPYTDSNIDLQLDAIPGGRSIVTLLLNDGSAGRAGLALYSEFGAVDLKTGNTQVLLPGKTTDPATFLSTGADPFWIFGRTDTDKLRLKTANVAADNFAMEAWVTAGFLAGARGNWKVFYSNGSGVVTELALGAANTYLAGNGVGAAPTFTTLPASGGYTVSAISADTSAVAGTFYLMTGAHTLTLPAASSNTNKQIGLKMATAVTGTVARTGADTIDGGTSRSLTEQYQTEEYISDGTNWWVK